MQNMIQHGDHPPTGDLYSWVNQLGFGVGLSKSKIFLSATILGIRLQAEASWHQAITFWKDFFCRCQARLFPVFVHPQTCLVVLLDSLPYQQGISGRPRILRLGSG